MRADEVRERFLRYFTDRGHTEVESSPVIPHGDPTLLFTNAGMNQFKDALIGRERRPYVRATSCQKCIRAGGKHNDLENVGYTARHLTFFEMLGNFSFGEYFKREAIRFAWELVTEGYGLDPDRLWVTVYRDDDEARAIWRREVGVPPARIIGLGAKDNFWSMGDVGPCGPCSELLYDRGEAFACGPECGIGRCDCDRYFEVWNLVFVQYDQAADGTRTPLEHRGIDTGMGLERIAMVVQGVDSVFEIDILRGIIRRIEERSGVPCDRGEAGIPHRVIADHLRSLVFAFADGAYPSNEGRGYVLRRILRRAARYGRELGFREPFLWELARTVVEIMGGAYPELGARRDVVERTIRGEEERFNRTLDQGLARFEEIHSRLLADGSTVIPGREVFLLYDTFGFPVDLVERMAAEAGLAVDREGYEVLMEAQRERSRAGSRFEAEALLAGAELADLPETEFIGYTEWEAQATVAGVVEDGEGGLAVLLDRTPFYGEAGGQVGDTGVLEAEGLRFRVRDTVRCAGRFLHRGRIETGDRSALRPGQVVRARIDAGPRAAIQRHHTATHLVHAALREVLGTHVEQKGSLVEPARLRFDFSHAFALEPEEIDAVERRVNEEILRDTPVQITHMAREEAEAAGAMALFGEKYGETVRVVRIAGFSAELCGGAHVSRTGEIGSLAIVSESSVAAGVRRIEAVAGLEAVRRARALRDELGRIAGLLKVPQEGVGERLEAILAELKALRTRGTPRRKDVAELVARADGGEERIGEVSVLWRRIPEIDAGELRLVADGLKAGGPKRIVLLAGLGKGRVALVVALSPDLRPSGIRADAIVRAGASVVGGGGGGRADMAQAGGKRVDRVEEALEAMREAARSQCEGAAGGTT